MNEVDNPGTVNAGDYNAWRARFGNTSDSGSVEFASATVPEPGTLVLAALCLFGVPFLRRPKLLQLPFPFL